MINAMLKVSGANIDKVENLNKGIKSEIPKDVLDDYYSLFDDDLKKEDLSPSDETNCNDEVSEGLTYEDKVEMQDKCIEDVESGDGELKSNQEKGNYGEMKVDKDLRDKGYERISDDMVTGLDDKTHQGIDGVYYKEGGEPEYIILDAKYGKSDLSETKDGTKQMSDKWIDDRLDSSVGKEKADEIRLEKITNEDNVGSYVARIDEGGNVTYDKLDNDGNVTEKDVKIND